MKFEELTNAQLKNIIRQYNHHLKIVYSKLSRENLLKTVNAHFEIDGNMIKMKNIEPIYFDYNHSGVFLEPVVEDINIENIKYREFKKLVKKLPRRGAYDEILYRDLRSDIAHIKSHSSKEMWKRKFDELRKRKLGKRFKSNLEGSVRFLKQYIPIYNFLEKNLHKFKDAKDYEELKDRLDDARSAIGDTISFNKAIESLNIKTL